MASRRSSGAISTRDGAEAVGDAFQLVAQGLAQLQEALRLEKQEAERKVQEAEERMQEALRLQEERAATALRGMERKLQKKDKAITALQHRLQETQVRLAAVEGRTTAPGRSAGGGEMQVLERRVNDVEASLKSALETFMPRVDAVLRQLEEPRSTRVSIASSTPTPTSSGAGHQGAAADEEERARQRLEFRMREVELRRERARTSPSSLGEQLCKAAHKGRLSDVRHLLDSGADVNYIDVSGYTPLINAAMYAHADVVSLLLQRGADANAVNLYGCSALQYAACEDRSGRCVKLLLREGADVDARNKIGETPLHCAAYMNNEEAVRALFAAGARRDLKPWGGHRRDKTPFDIAASNIKALLRLQC